MINKLILISILFLAIPFVNATNTTSTTPTTRPTTTTTMPCCQPFSCSGTTTHYCNNVYKSVDSIVSITAPVSVDGCGQSNFSVTVIWTGRHNSNDNHWGFFVDNGAAWVYVDSCKSQYQTGEGITNTFTMSCMVDVPPPGTIANGIHELMVTGEDYGGYCNPGETGVDAQKTTSITFYCGSVTTTSTSTTSTGWTTTTSIPLNCKSTDSSTQYPKGDNPFLSGSATPPCYYEYGTIGTNIDNCIDSNSLDETYCPTQMGYCYHKIIKCSDYGMRCMNGACVFYDSTTSTSTTIKPTPTTIRTRGGGGGSRFFLLGTEEGLNNPIVILVALIAVVVIIYGAFKFFAKPKRHR